MSCAVTSAIRMNVRTRSHALTDVQMRGLRPQLAPKRPFTLRSKGDQHQTKQQPAPERLNGPPIAAAENPHSAFPLDHIQFGPDCAG